MDAVAAGINVVRMIDDGEWIKNLTGIGYELV